MNTLTGGRSFVEKNGEEGSTGYERHKTHELETKGILHLTNVGKSLRQTTSAGIRPQLWTAEMSQELLGLLWALEATVAMLNSRSLWQFPRTSVSLARLPISPPDRRSRLQNP